MVNKDPAFKPGAYDPALSLGAREVVWEEGYDYGDLSSSPDMSGGVSDEAYHTVCWLPEEEPVTGTLNPRMLEDPAFQGNPTDPNHYGYAANVSLYEPLPCTAGNVPQNL
ncbi:hypothetical protein MRS44_013626 [Fusarium solani]|uniref:uncharacterized protein n=1 Tax=Fusarium solani TaxID=169388 RepID=UPI0032C4A6BE|nr:hypothetical protein MRS44_013626 [Fusarium solani]